MGRIAPPFCINNFLAFLLLFEVAISSKSFLCRLSFFNTHGGLLMLELQRFRTHSRTLLICWSLDDFKNFFLAQQLLIECKCERYGNCFIILGAMMMTCFHYNGHFRYDSIALRAEIDECMKCKHFLPALGSTTTACMQKNDKAEPSVNSWHLWAWSWSVNIKLTWFWSNG